MANIIQVKNLNKTFGSRNTLQVVLNQCSFEIEEGKMTAVIGKSGSGKTTLLNIIGGLESADSGSVRVDGEELTGKNQAQLSDFRNDHVGFIFQDFELLSDYTVLENICFIPDLMGFPRNRKRLNELLEKLELIGQEDSYPDQLSGGEKQRTAIARALIGKPAIVLADEPTGNLDRLSSESVFRLLKECSEMYHQTVLMVTHDLSLAKQADALFQIEDGKVIPYG